jgi:hypothetical protein
MSFEDLERKMEASLQKPCAESIDTYVHQQIFLIANTCIVD